MEKHISSYCVCSSVVQQSGLKTNLWLRSSSSLLTILSECSHGVSLDQFHWLGLKKDKRGCCESREHPAGRPDTDFIRHHLESLALWKAEIWIRLFSRVCFWLKEKEQKKTSFKSKSMCWSICCHGKKTYTELSRVLSPDLMGLDRLRLGSSMQACYTTCTQTHTHIYTLGYVQSYPSPTVNRVESRNGKTSQPPSSPGHSVTS